MRLPPEIAQAASSINVALAHSLLPQKIPLVPRGTHTITMRGSREDIGFLKLIARANDISTAELMSRIWAMHCRAFRTQRGPDGQIIDYTEIPTSTLPDYILQLLHPTG